jgi:hypothetical protein
MSSEFNNRRLFSRSFVSPFGTILNDCYCFRLGLRIVEDEQDPLANIQVSEATKKLMRENAEKYDKEKEQKKQEREKLEASQLIPQNQQSLSTITIKSQAPSFTSSVYRSGEVTVDAK